jgi:hypothetical protein
MLPLPVYARHRRIRAERPRAIDLAGGAVRRDHLVRRDAFLDPVLERRQHVEGVRPGPPEQWPMPGA